MISVRSVLKKKEQSSISGLCGVLVIMDGGVYLLDEFLEKPWQATPSIKIAITDLKYALMLQLAQMGGGSSIFFHKAIIDGNWNGAFLEPTTILSKDVKNGDWREIDFSSETIEKGKGRYKHLDSLDEEIVDFWTNPHS